MSNLYLNKCIMGKHPASLSWSRGFNFPTCVPRIALRSQCVTSVNEELQLEDINRLCKWLKC